MAEMHHHLYRSFDLEENSSNCTNLNEPSEETNSALQEKSCSMSTLNNGRDFEQLTLDKDLQPRLQENQKISSENLDTALEKHRVVSSSQILSIQEDGASKSSSMNICNGQSTSLQSESPVQTLCLEEENYPILDDEFGRSSLKCQFSSEPEDGAFSDRTEIVSPKNTETDSEEVLCTLSNSKRNTGGSFLRSSTQEPEERPCKSLVKLDSKNNAIPNLLFCTTHKILYKSDHGIKENKFDRLPLVSNCNRDFRSYCPIFKIQNMPLDFELAIEKEELDREVSAVKNDTDEDALVGNKQILPMNGLELDLTSKLNYDHENSVYSQPQTSLNQSPAVEERELAVDPLFGSNSKRYLEQTPDSSHKQHFSRFRNETFSTSPERVTQSELNIRSPSGSNSNLNCEQSLSTSQISRIPSNGLRLDGQRRRHGISISESNYSRDVEQNSLIHSRNNILLRELPSNSQREQPGHFTAETSFSRGYQLSERNTLLSKSRQRNYSSTGSSCTCHLRRQQSGNMAISKQKQLRRINNGPGQYLYRADEMLALHSRSTFVQPRSSICTCNEYYRKQQEMQRNAARSILNNPRYSPIVHRPSRAPKPPTVRVLERRHTIPEIYLTPGEGRLSNAVNQRLYYSPQRTANVPRNRQVVALQPFERDGRISNNQRFPTSHSESSFKDYGCNDLEKFLFMDFIDCLCFICNFMGEVL